ncbi:hypothetical protein Tco_0843807, partial [Tanacetum coccineum]
DHILKGDIELHFIPTQYQLADIFTKPLDELTFKRLIVELGGIRGDMGINTFRNALRDHYLPRSSGKTGGLDQISNKDATILYCLANRVKVDYVRLIWEDIIHKLSKKTREKAFSVHNWALKPNQTKGPPFIDHMKAICNLDVLMDPKAPKPSSQTEEVPQGKKPGAKSGLKKQSLKHTSESKTEASKSKTGQSEKEAQSSSAKDKSPSHPLPPTPVVGEMHKEAQQALVAQHQGGATNKVGAHPSCSSKLFSSSLALWSASGHDASADSTAEADPGLSPPNDSIHA